MRAVPILLLLAGSAYGAECTAPPVTTDQQAICLTAKHLGYTDADIKMLKLSAINRGDAWLVSIAPIGGTPSGVAGLPSGFVAIDAATGKVLSRDKSEQLLPQ